MKILSIIMKSGIKIDLRDASEMDLIRREELTVTHKGLVLGEETKWQPAPERKTVTYLRAIKGGSAWEFREDEIAAFEFEYNEETDKIEKEDIKI